MKLRLRWIMKPPKKIRDLIFNLPITIIEVAHHIDDESRYDDIITFRKENAYESC